MKVRKEGEDKRQLRRNQIFPGYEMQGTLDFEESKFEVHIVDFHSGGAKVRLSPEDFLRVDKKLEATARLSIRYGANLIGNQIGCRIRRIESENLTLGLAFEDQKAAFVARDGERVQLEGAFTPSLISQDPLRINEKIFFRVKNMSYTGARLITSLSNRHLIKGMKILGATLILPTAGMETVDFEIRSVTVNEGFLEIGAQFIKPTENFKLLLAGFLFQHGFASQSHEKVREELAVEAKDLGKFFRIFTVNTSAQYQDVLEIRHQAYLQAKKIDTVDPVALADEYDERAAILLAQSGGVVVGTVRLVFCKEGESLPLEKYLSLPEDLLSQKAKLTEISRLAILPKFQGSDLVIKFFQEVARIIIANDRVGVCMATDELRPMYIKLGARDAKVRVPHYNLPGEFLNLLVLYPDDFIHGRGMYGLTWKKVAVATLNHLRSHQLIGRGQWWVSLKMFFKQKLEKALLKAVRLLNKKG